MLADLDETLRQMLLRHVPLDPTEVEISFEAPDREWSGRLSRPAVNCFLYDVRENHRLRPSGWEIRRENGVATKHSGPLRFDVTYQITVWARAREDEHQLLWRVLAALVKHPTLPADLLQGNLKQQPVPIPAWVSQPEHMPQNYADLWQALDNRIRPSLTYVLTLALDPEIGYTSPLVLSDRPTVDMGNLDRHEMAEAHQIRGQVRDRQDPTKVIAGALVLLRETGARARTDDEGRFTFSGAPRGPVTLVVRAPGRTETTWPINVPDPSCELDV